MPSSTFAFPFEMKILTVLSTMIGENTALCTFSSSGTIQLLQQETPPSPSWFQKQKELQDTNQSHIFYDPFDAPEYTFISWQNIPQELMESLLQQPFEPNDFVGYRSKKTIPYPASWIVMF